MDTSTIGTYLIHRGAEADLYASKFAEWNVVIKERVKKKYRDSGLDRQIRKERTVKEASGLHEARKAGVRTPTLFAVDLESFSVSMSLLEGRVARDGLDETTSSMVRKIFYELGVQIGRLHGKGLVHGDLTTSNVILVRNEIPFLIDFGMSSHSEEPEDRGVDLHLLQRSLLTSHTLDDKSCVKAAFHGYRKTLGPDEANETLRKQLQISRRGRYFAIR